jgi:hypothetical protein
MNNIEFSHKMKVMIQSNQPYYMIFDEFIHFMIECKIFMNYYEMFNSVRIYIKPYASCDLLNYFEKNLNNL